MMNSYSARTSSSYTLEKKHINDVQPASLNEHVRLLREDESIIESKYAKKSLDDLPEWFDEKLFRRGQEFQRKNMLAFGVIHLSGLLAIISAPSTVKILTFTKQSSTACLAFRRYTGTIALIRLLINSDIYDPNRRWFKGLNAIRQKHVTASRSHMKEGFHGIYQRDMGITQFGFMGFAFSVPEKVGLRHCTPEDLEGLNHFWRVTGHLLDISDRMNICRKTVEETTELCKRIANEILVEYLEKPLPEFQDMVVNVMDGLWYADLSLNRNSFLAMVYDFVGAKYPNPLNWLAQMNLTTRQWLLHLCSVPYIGIVVRIYFNYLLEFLYWTIAHYPVLGWIKFGKKNVEISHY